LVTPGTLVHDFNLLDEDMAAIDAETRRMTELGNKNGQDDIKKFINEMRRYYLARAEMNRAYSVAAHRAGRDAVAVNKSDENIRRILNRARNAGDLDTEELAKQLEDSLDYFVIEISLIIRYHPALKDAETNAYRLAELSINRRKQMLLEIKDLFDNPAFNGLVEVNSLNALRRRLEILAETRYADLYKSLVVLDKLFREFNVRLDNVYNTTETLDIVKGIDLKPVGFFGSLFGKKSIKTVPITISNNDMTKIRAIQQVTHELHNTSVKMLRARQASVLTELKQIKIDEADVRSTLKKAFGRATRKITLKAA